MGDREGIEVGSCVDGDKDGCWVGDIDGRWVGDDDGVLLGDMDGIGDEVGAEDIQPLGDMSNEVTSCFVPDTYNEIALDCHSQTRTEIYPEYSFSDVQGLFVSV